MADLQELGHPATATGELRLRITGVPGSARTRLTAIGALLVDDDGDIHAELVSTRLPPEDLADVARRLADTPHAVIVLAHTGAERAAAELVAAGATGLVGEGNEEALLGLVEDDRSPTTLLGSYERRFSDVGAGGGHGRDPQTGLLDRRSFERRIGELADHDEVPRVGSLRITSDRWADAIAHPVVTLQRRRLATVLAHVCGAVHTELYQLGPDEYGLIGLDLSPNAMEHLGDRLVAVAATFRDRGLQLRLVIGHAGAESSTDVEELVDLSHRALDVATADGARSLMGAEQLALGVSVTTELEASLKLVAGVEGQTRRGPGHGERVGRIVAELARARGWPPAAVARIQLAGHLHDVGRVRIPVEAIDGPHDLTGELLEAWRTFPVHGAHLLRLTAGPVVADTVHDQCERWDGDGFPNGRRGTEIPETARLLAVAHRVEELTWVEGGADVPTVVAGLRAAAGAELEPELVDEAVTAMPTLLHAAARTLA